MRKPALLAALVACAAPFLACAQAQSPNVSGAVVTEPGRGSAVAIVSMNAKVEAIDKATRKVTLKTSSGETHVITAGEEVRNFDQIKVGDTVKAKYMEALTLELKKGGKAVVGRTESATMDRAAPGQKPGAVATREETVIADVVAVDQKAMLVKVKNDRGEVVDLHLRDPEQVKLVKKGDQVQATYTTAFAVALEPAAK
jgi:hypothetical protein